MNILLLNRASSPHFPSEEETEHGSVVFLKPTNPQ